MGQDRVTTVNGTEPANDSGKLQLSTTDPVNFVIAPSWPTNPVSTPMINVVANPFAPFEVDTLTVIGNTTRIANSGSGVRWTYFTGALEGTGDHHRLITMIDPLTGHGRLIFGDDQGIFTGVDENGN